MAHDLICESASASDEPLMEVANESQTSPDDPQSDVQPGEVTERQPSPMQVPLSSSEREQLYTEIANLRDESDAALS